MKQVTYCGKIYNVDVNYTGESDIFDENNKRINSEISGELYYTLLVKAKSIKECSDCGCRDGNHAQECKIYYAKGYGLR